MDLKHRNNAQKMMHKFNTKYGHATPMQNYAENVLINVQNRNYSGL